MQFIPGSHRKLLPHVKAPPDMAFLEMADPTHVDSNLTIEIEIELEHGEFMLLNERLLHQSEVNTSNLQRCG